MPMAAIDAYLAELPGLLAEWRMQSFEAVMLPYLKPMLRRRAVREAQALAYGEDEKERVTAPPKVLALIGIKVVRAE